MPFLIYNTVIFKNKNAKSLYNNGESTKNKKIITLLKKQMKDQVLLDLMNYFFLFVVFIYSYSFKQ